MQIKKGYKIREIAGEQVIIMQGKHGVDMTKLLALNTTSKYLYENLMDIEFDEDKVVSLLLDRFQVEEVTARKDAQSWIAKLEEVGLIER